MQILIHDVEHRFYRAVFHLQNVLPFHGTHVNVISFRDIKKAQPSLSRFSRNPQKLNKIMTRSLEPNFTLIEKMDVEILI